MSILSSEIESVVKAAFIPVLEVVQKELVAAGVVSQSTLDNFYGHITAFIDLCKPVLSLVLSYIALHFAPLVPAVQYLSQIYTDLSTAAVN